MDNEKKLTILTIKNTLKNMDLLRVHIYEHSIRFDAKVDEAIKKYPELNDDVLEMNDMWKKNEINEKQVLVIILHIMGRYSKYLEKFYFTEDELDSNGCYVDKEEEDLKKAFYPPYSLVIGEEMSFFYKYFIEQGCIKKISKKTFEQYIPDEEIAEKYVENYKYKGARFFKAVLEEEKQISYWYFMVFENIPIMAYEILDESSL